MAGPETFTDHLARHPESAALVDAVRAVVAGLGPVTERMSRSQLAFRRRRTVALVWAPGQYLGDRGAPLVLTIPLARHDRSPRWKEVVEPRPGRFTHHLELHDAADLDDDVRAWLREAYDAAG